MARLHRQAAVIPYRLRKERIEVALVTSAGGKRWIVPKGTIDEGERPWDAAAREAEEEAGLLGVVDRTALGFYHSTNGNGRCRIDVFLMRVTAVLDHWMEDRLRHRRWMPLSDALARVHPDLRPFIQTVQDSLSPETHGDL